MVLKNPTAFQKGKTMVYFVRHGERKDHEKGQPRHPGPGISERGKKQAKAIAKEFAAIKDEIDVLYVSTMTRALETAKEIGKALHQKPKVEHHLSELDRTLEKRAYYSPKYWKAYRGFITAKKTFNEILRLHQGKVIVIVTHGRLIRCLVGWKYGLSLAKSNAFDQHNCHVTLVRFKGTKIDYIHCFNSKGLVR